MAEDGVAEGESERHGNEPDKHWFACGLRVIHRRTRSVTQDSAGCKERAWRGGAWKPCNLRRLFALGVSGGLLPCPSALVVMLGAIALGRIAFGLLLIVAFSVGLAAVLTAIGLLFVYARRWFNHLPADGRVARYVPVASALVISVAGFLIVVQALAQMGVLHAWT